MTSIDTLNRLAVDIGGTFTDVALESGNDLYTSKVPTTPSAPEEGVLNGIQRVIEESGVAASDINLIVHGTTLATNALIERKGAKTALITTKGHRDSVEMAYENRFAQYDIDIDRPDPLVPRYLRLPVDERLGPDGSIIRPLDEQTVTNLIPFIQSEDIESIAIGLLHSYANPLHEDTVADILASALPDLRISKSSEVCPEIREYERQSTTCANAYVQPLIAQYLIRLNDAVLKMGFNCPFTLMTSGGGLTDLETAIKFPIRLVESGPAGGAILASQIAGECGFDQVLSFDMGGTTAKLCLIDDAKPLMSRTFEVDRVYRFMKGSGLPIRIPVIEMVEIGSGGGSIARVDELGRITVGPDSSGADPGPACYGHGGVDATVTDADLLMGRLDPDNFAAGNMSLSVEAAQSAMDKSVASPLNLDRSNAAYAVSELVDETMASAARVHATEWGKDISGRSMIAFGGAAPLHAGQLARKLGIDTVVIPTGAGVGSAIGFLRAPVAYEVVRSRFHALNAFDAKTANTIIDDMRAEAMAIVEPAAMGATLIESRAAYMRYQGQGHEITVELPSRELTASDGETLSELFAETYTALYGRTIPGLAIEILSWTLTISTETPVPSVKAQPAPHQTSGPSGTRKLFDPALKDWTETPVYDRSALPPGAEVSGPAIIAEGQTTTIVPSGYHASINALSYIVLHRNQEELT
jgi:N-methylhydantoinase A